MFAAALFTIAKIWLQHKCPSIDEWMKKNRCKEVKDLYLENYTTQQKEIKEDTNEWKHVPCHGLEELTSSKWPYYPKQLIDSMQSLLEYL